mgnify:FL=1
MVASVVKLFYLSSDFHQKEISNLWYNKELVCFAGFLITGVRS